ncbi:oligopeptide ABC transporter ATP-binding protein [Spiroplasma helicoides]|uniref:Oligopeptide ABC transporter ATP-binding protein n=1 Tax=Spiroplasma helicoides TaxID=216938 RepID=A0A1B3SKL0_9MOLU|nr:oligopeptide ABC transporter ATP-binding protein OppD [Spiroplasma helicoides]AOG60453.1 oligopeptide ABC transporter ATP-binding protein [Spiroplasma helicoides]
MENKENRLLSVRNLEVRFQVRGRYLTAIRNVSFDVYDQEILAIVGESGSGKSVVTKTFTGMLEDNGWISDGSIIYRPNEASKEDPNAYFKKAVDLVNLQKPLISKDVIKFISKRNKKQVRKLKSEIKKYFLLNPSLVEEDQKRGIDEATYKATIKKNNLVIDQKISQAQETLNKMKESQTFSNSNRVFKKVTKAEHQLEKLEEQKKIINDKEYRQKKVDLATKEIQNLYSDTSKVKPLNILQRFALKKIVKWVATFITNKVPFNEQQINITQNYFDSRKHLIRFESELKDIVNEIINSQTVDVDHFENILSDWSKISNFDILNKMKAIRQIRHLRGKTVATIFQDPMTSLNPLLTVGHQITEVLRKQLKMSKSEAKKEAIELLRKVGIPEPEKRFKDIPGRYSGGMRQRVVIAIALACRPKVLICDEPTTALDVTIQAQILELIKDLQKELKFSVIFITHDLGVVASIADRIAVMYAGQIVEVGTAKDIFYDPRHPYTWALLSSLPQLGTKGEELYSIAGTPPSLFSNIKGDAFAPRNKHAMKIDYIAEPPMFKVSETHYAKTWLLHENAPKITKPEQLKELKSIIKESQEGN